MKISTRCKFSGNHGFVHYSPVAMRDVTRFEDIPKSVQHLYLTRGMTESDEEGAWG